MPSLWHPLDRFSIYQSFTLHYYPFIGDNIINWVSMYRLVINSALKARIVNGARVRRLADPPHYISQMEQITVVDIRNIICLHEGLGGFYFWLFGLTCRTSFRTQ